MITSFELIFKLMNSFRIAINVLLLLIFAITMKHIRMQIDRRDRLLALVLVPLDTVETDSHVQSESRSVMFIFLLYWMLTFVELAWLAVSISFIAFSQQNEASSCLCR